MSDKETDYLSIMQRKFSGFSPYCRDFFKVFSFLWRVNRLCCHQVTTKSQIGESTSA